MAVKDLRAVVEMFARNLAWVQAQPDASYADLVGAHQDLDRAIERLTRALNPVTYGLWSNGRAR